MADERYDPAAAPPDPMHCAVCPTLSPPGSLVCRACGSAAISPYPRLGEPKRWTANRRAVVAAGAGGGLTVGALIQFLIGTLNLQLGTGRRLVHDPDPNRPTPLPRPTVLPTPATPATLHQVVLTEEELTRAAGVQLKAVSQDGDGVARLRITHEGAQGLRLHQLALRLERDTAGQHLSSLTSARIPDYFPWLRHDFPWQSRFVSGADAGFVGAQQRGGEVESAVFGLEQHGRYVLVAASQRLGTLASPPDATTLMRLVSTAVRTMRDRVPG